MKLPSRLLLRLLLDNSKVNNYFTPRSWYALDVAIAIDVLHLLTPKSVDKFVSLKSPIKISLLITKTANKKEFYLLFVVDV